MARSPQQIGPAPWAGSAALAALLALVLGSFAAVLARAEGFGALVAADWAALRFTLWQAVLSAGLSCLLAVPVARALARRQFPGRNFLITALGAPFILPVIAAIIGLLAIFGRAGALNAGLSALGLPQITIYGPQGVIIAHVFLNLPLAVRLLLNGWAAIPAERFRLAAALDFGPRDIARLLEWPMLRQTMPGAALAIFLICLTSFTVALTLGGGPAATTLELAIYQAFRIEFDLAHAASLAGLQMGLSLLAAVLCLKVLTTQGFGAGLDRPVERWDSAGWAQRLADMIWLALMTTFLLGPIAMVLAHGLPQMANLPTSVWPALGGSILIALSATFIALCLSLAIALLITGCGPKTGRSIDAAAMLSLTASPLVLGTGLFLILRPLVNPVAWALVVIALVNAAMAMPFCLRALLPALRTLRADYDRLADSLDMAGLARLRWLILPRLRRPLGFAGGLAAALSMGDLGVVTLFADPSRASLPMQIYALTSAYRNDQAAAAAIVLIVASFALFWAFDRWGRN